MQAVRTLYSTGEEVFKGIKEGAVCGGIGALLPRSPVGPTEGALFGIAYSTTDYVLEKLASFAGFDTKNDDIIILKKVCSIAIGTTIFAQFMTPLGIMDATIIAARFLIIFIAERSIYSELPKRARRHIQSGMTISFLGGAVVPCLQHFALLSTAVSPIHGALLMGGSYAVARALNCVIPPKFFGLNSPLTFLATTVHFVARSSVCLLATCGALYAFAVPMTLAEAGIIYAVVHNLMSIPAAVQAKEKNIPTGGILLVSLARTITAFSPYALIRTAGF